MNELVMELRRVDADERCVTGVVAPYDEVTYLTPDPDGETIRRGAFKRSINGRHNKIPLLRNHDTNRVLGCSQAFTESDAGLEGRFVVNPGGPGDDLLEECRHGYLRGMSIGFRPLKTERGPGGVRHIVEARLVEVSMVAIPAYEGAAMLSVRNAQDLDALLAPFAARPDVNLAPIPTPWRPGSV